VGEIRWKISERIRRRRRGLVEVEANEAVEIMRESMDMVRDDVDGGILVVGRNTWKEYVRGLHEGWLGPDDEPLEESNELATPLPPPTPPTVTPLESLETESEATRQAEEAAAASAKSTPEKPKKPTVPPSLIETAAYASANLAQNIPANLPPTHPVPCPHILGFFNFPIRIYRYLNQRVLADQVGRETVSIALGLYTTFPTSEITTALISEEADWSKKYRPGGEGVKLTDEEKEQGVVRDTLWQDDVVIDGRIAERMRKYEIVRDLDGGSGSNNTAGATIVDDDFAPKKSIDRHDSVNMDSDSDGK